MEIFFNIAWFIWLYRKLETYVRHETKNSKPEQPSRGALSISSRVIINWSVVSSQPMQRLELASYVQLMKVYNTIL